MLIANQRLKWITYQLVGQTTYLVWSSAGTVLVVMLICSPDVISSGSLASSG